LHDRKKVSAESGREIDQIEEVVTDEANSIAISRVKVICGDFEIVPDD